MSSPVVTPVGTTLRLRNYEYEFESPFTEHEPRNGQPQRSPCNCALAVPHNTRQWPSGKTGKIENAYIHVIFAVRISIRFEAAGHGVT